MKQGTKRLFGLFLVLTMVFSLLPAASITAAADSVPEAAELVWDMENLPEDLFENHWAMSIIGNQLGHGEGIMNAAAAKGKGVGGSTAVTLTLTEKATADNLWASGVYYRICEDETAQNDWFGASEIWFWLDLSEFTGGDIEMEFMIDGVHTSLDTPFSTIQNGKRTENYASATYTGSPYGRPVLPAGFAGWIGFPASGFNTTIGKIQNIGIALYARADVKSFPLSAYIDEFRIVREDTSDAPIRKSGELFNKDIGAGEYTLYTNITDVHQKIESYGASGCWWTTAAGTGDFVDDALRLVFTDQGAGLNNYRHNIGASVAEDLSDAGNMQPGRAVPSPLNENGDYQEDRDLGGYTVLKKLVDLGTIDDFTLFINSPPSVMTKSGMVFGDAWEENKGNLREDCYDLFAEYVVDMVQLYNYLGVPIRYVSPINEPQWDWTAGTQEGCHYSPNDAQTIIELVAKELIRRTEEEDNTLANVKVSFAESGSWIDKSFVNYLYLKLAGNEEISSRLAHISGHSYASDADAKSRLMKEMQNMGANVRFRQTEYGPTQEQADFSIKTAMEVARVMYEDLSILDVDGWSYWLACSSGQYTDGLCYYNFDSPIVQPTKRLWAMGQYARFTKGATRVGVDEYGMPYKVYSTAYVNRDQDALVYVVVNDFAEDVTFSFAGLPGGSVADVYETSALRNLELRGTMTSDAGYTLPAQSVTTFVFQGMDITAVKSSAHPENTTGSVVRENFDYSVFDAVQETEVKEETEPVTEPEAEAAKSEPHGNALVFIGIGIAAVLVIAGIVTVILVRWKKKKDRNAAQQKDEP